MYDIVFFGIQGAGKGTQASLFLEKYPYAFRYLSTGDIFRALTSNDNAIGNYLHDRLTKGDLIDDTVTSSLFQTYFHTVRDDKKYMFLDGYPRSSAQLDDLMALAEKYERKMLGIHFTLPDDIAVERLLERGRNDDTLDAIHHRIAQFYEQTMPIISSFGDYAPLITIDANKSVEQIHEEVLSVVADAKK